MKKKTTVMPRAALIALFTGLKERRHSRCDTNEYLLDWIAGYPFPSFDRSTWGHAFSELAGWIQRGADCNTPVRVFGLSGNSKLGQRFVTFSSIPGISCPGAGDCFDGAEGPWSGFCYSMKALRNQWPVVKMIVSWYLLNHDPRVIDQLWRMIPRGRMVRLYIDGDVENQAQLFRWMARIARRPDLQVYNYSKSWEIYLDCHARGIVWPENYTLNISDGARYDNDTRARMLALPCARGTFEGVAGPLSMVYARAQELKSNGEKAFVCGGDCSSCIRATADDPIGHGCGSKKRFTGVRILTPIH